MQGVHWTVKPHRVMTYSAGIDAVTPSLPTFNIVTFSMHFINFYFYLQLNHFSVMCHEANVFTWTELEVGGSDLLGSLWQMTAVRHCFNQQVTQRAWCVKMWLIIRNNLQHTSLSESRSFTCDFQVFTQKQKQSPAANTPWITRKFLPVCPWTNRATASLSDSLYPVWASTSC